MTRALKSWNAQLEEFAHKAIARRDTQAANEIIRTMTAVGIKYAESRRDSLVLRPEWAGVMPMGVSDISEVHNPIYESLRNICDAAARQPIEVVVIGCVRACGDLALHSMTMIHSQEGWRTAPLAYSPVYYIDICVQKAITADMDDALLAAITCTGQIFGRISNDVDTQTMEATAIACLFRIASTSDPRQSFIPCFRAVEMMLLAARQELRVRGLEPAAHLGTVLKNIAALVPYEALMDKAGKRVMQTFPPYFLGFEANIPALLEELANRVTADPARFCRNKRGLVV